MARCAQARVIYGRQGGVNEEMQGRAVERLERVELNTFQSSNWWAFVQGQIDIFHNG